MPPGVMSVLPEDAVADVMVSVPCDGAACCVHVSVWLASASLTCNKALMSVAEAFWQSVSACGLESVKEGVILDGAVTITPILLPVLLQPVEDLVTVRVPV